ncbi:MAG: carbamate kinase [Actinomycetota bacterium]
MSRADGVWAQKPILVVALGGTAITRPEDGPSVKSQFERTRETVETLLPIVASGAYRIVLTHGNGPQVGSILLRSDIAAEAGVLPRLPIDSAVADTQGAMGYMIQQCFSNALWESGIRLPVVTVVTQVLVDDEDPAFQNPTKPIGRFYSAEEVEKLKGHGWVMTEQKGGWRRVVPSPIPSEIIEEDVIRELLDAGVIVIACGGGGVPVVAAEGGSLRGVEAVIDKDLATSLLATHIGAQTLAILTAVDNVSLNYGTGDEVALDEVDVDDLRLFASEGQFPAGSMGPKIDAVVGFVERGGPQAIITSAEKLAEALEGKAGTHIVGRAVRAEGT